MNKTKSNGLLTLHNHGFEFQIWLCMSSEYIVVGNKIKGISRNKNLYMTNMIRKNVLT